MTVDVKMIKATDLKVDPETQRRYDSNHAKKIAAHFDPTLLGLLDVSERVDGYYIVDGQHRTRAAIIAGHGDKMLACNVTKGMTLQEEARRFVGVNGTVKKPTTMDMFRLRVQAGDVTANEINNMLTKFGLRVSSGHEPGTVAAVSAFEQVHKQGHLEDVLRVLQQAWQRDRDAYAVGVVKGVGLLLQNYPYVDRVRLADRLAKSGTPGKILGRSRSLADATRQSQPISAMQVMVEIYNHSLKSGRLR